MGNFLENIFAELHKAAERVVLREVRGGEFISVSGRELLQLVAQARGFLRNAGMQAGERCALLGVNSIQWTAINLALMAENIVVVPLYARQSNGELAGMMKDCGARLLLAGDAGLAESVGRAWPELSMRAAFDEVCGKNFAREEVDEALAARAESSLVTIIYTSGTSGDPKGVCLSVGNVNHMLGCTTGWMDCLEKNDREPIRVFQYLPFNFAASWIVMMSCLSRETVLTLSTDLNRVADEIRISAPNYFFNVPTLLVRFSRAVEEAIGKRGAGIQMIYRKARAAWQRKVAGESRGGNGFWLFLARKLIFKQIRARFGPNLQGLVCGSAPLAPETQDFFAMLGIPIWQVYGLTETCGICTMDDPRIAAEAGRVGRAIPGIEMMAGENEEILVRGPNIFAGYWNRPEETARVMKDGWFHSGDQGEANSRGNWRITGRIKNLIILNSGHNVAPEPIEEKIAQRLPGAQQVVVVGNGWGYLSALVTGMTKEQEVQEGLDAVNQDLPHYRQVRNFTLLREPFTAEGGLLTANGKVRRDVINAKYRGEIERMYQKQAAAAGKAR